MVGRVNFGVETPGAADVPALLDTAREQWQVNFCVVPLAHPRYWRDHRRPRHEQFTRSDLVLDSESWSGHVMGKISPWLQLDSADPTCRRQSEAAFKQEVAWASHLTLQSVLVPPPGAQAVNYARCINQAVLAAPHVHIWVRVPLTHPARGDQAAAAPAEEAAAAAADGDEETSSGCGAWASWNRLRCLCEHVPNVGVALQLTADLPDDPEEMARWCGEPVRAVLIPASIFLTNRKGYPTLSRRHQAALQQLMPHRPQLVVSGRPDAHGEGLGAHVQYLRFLVSKLSPLTQQEKYEAPYYDFLQVRSGRGAEPRPAVQPKRASCRGRGGGSGSSMRRASLAPEGCDSWLELPAVASTAAAAAAVDAIAFAVVAVALAVAPLGLALC